MRIISKDMQFFGGHFLGLPKECSLTRGNNIYNINNIFKKCNYLKTNKSEKSQKMITIFIPEFEKMYVA